MKKLNSSFCERCEIFAEYIIETGATIRQTASYFEIGKSTVHKDLTIKLKNINPELHKNVRLILLKNKSERHLRGGEATRKKYIEIKRAKAVKNGKT